MFESFTSFVLLDDCESSPVAQTSRLYSGFAKEYRCVDVTTLNEIWRAVDYEIESGLHAVLLVDYDWGVNLAGLQDKSTPLDEKGALRVLMYHNMVRMSTDEVEQWLRKCDGDGPPSIAGCTVLKESIERNDFEASIENILKYIREGETYQINFTYRLNGYVFGSPIALYRRLRARQPVQFGALIALPGDSKESLQWVLSCSPELFARCEQGQIVTRPMKGTAARDNDPVRDERQKEWLARDEKNRAENVMIVDLLRNDLGRIAKIGSVKVSRLFEIESYSAVHQMTSTVNAVLRDGISFPDVLQALFPSGSITGAPKYHSMELIASLERSSRGLYTGAIGWLDKRITPQTCGDFCMSIAIRTILLGQPENGMRPAELGVGGGIVADSKPAVEFEETRLKARFITGLDPGFGLFETMRASRLRGIRDLDAHLNRLVSSACKFGFTYDLVAIRQLLLQAVNKLEPGLIFRLRLDLAHDGSMALTVDELLPTLEIPALYVISEHPLPENERALVGHKTTFRRTYDTAIRYAESVGAFDALFFNDRGELTEGARTNVFVRSNGYWWTPPLECGLLPGILRARLLNHTTQVQERVIRRGDLIRAEAVILCNGLRGIIRAIPAKCLPICARTAFQTDLAPPRCRYSSQALRSRRQ